MRFLLNSFIATALLFGLLGLLLGQAQGHANRQDDARSFATQLFLAKSPTASPAVLSYARWSLDDEPPSPEHAVLNAGERKLFDSLLREQAEAVAAVEPPFPLSLFQD